MKKLITFCITMAIVGSAQAGLLFNYSQLALKDLDQMNKLVRSKIQESKKSGGNKVIPLKEALQAVFSRSNEDFMIEKITPQLKVEMDEHDSWEPSIQALVKEALGALGNPKAFKPVVQVTYLIFLENMIAELKPRLDEKFERKIITQIRDAKISVTKEAVNERRLRVMKETTSPSLIAEAVLKEHEEMKKAAPPSTVPAAPAAKKEISDENESEQ
ncbi:MAG: hypothetical protein ACAH59_03215 [Pseudobdellovibrionaceae bacterium]